ncbi:MAG: ATP-binding protein [Micrococcales bacterium]|nr:ATP-binding protein [Micrococcales bacterium]OJX68894.1 MAG: AAA family ATPase [Micrococcales bacterium 72-143]
MNDAAIEALRRAVAAAPDDVDLRVHLGELLARSGRTAESLAEAAVALQLAPENLAAQALMRVALDRSAAPAEPTLPHPGFDWASAEAQLDGTVPPMFVTQGAPDGPVFEREASTITFADVGGMDRVKERLDAAFLAPLRNPELRALYGKKLRGGLLMYGPPGCGKTYLARAIAGELGAAFINVGLADVLDPMLGVSESNVHEIFQQARRDGPTVLFLDEVDALGQRRSKMVGNAMRGVVNQLLIELDGVASDNDGLFVLAATNQPWDVDPAFRRPGRFDRTVLVLPPDLTARRAILASELTGRPVESIDLDRLAAATDGYSGADLAHICEAASESALLDSVRTGRVRMIGMGDLEAAIREVRPSIGEWLDIARNVVLFGNDDGSYSELRDFLKRRKRI